MKKIVAIVGARPQFIKHYPLELACRNKINLVTVHTGQHYDENMSKVFFDQLGMSKPNYNLEIGSASHGVQTAKMMIGIEEILEEEKPDYLLVYGDTNSTIAGALVASKIHVPIVHIEAGLRSYNTSMPEEVNRVLTDHISSYLFVPSEQSVQNLKREGIVKNVYTVGDIMKDLVEHCVSNQLVIEPSVKEPYYYATLHRPYNTDEEERLSYVLNTLNTLNHKVVFSIHPRTKHKMKLFGLERTSFKNIDFINPQGYLENLGYLQGAEALITDSGGMQKEAYWTNTKCITMRSETEWTETLEGGSNHLVFEDLSQIKTHLENTKDVTFDKGLYGSANAAELIINKLI